MVRPPRRVLVGLIVVLVGFSAVAVLRGGGRPGAGRGPGGSVLLPTVAFEGVSYHLVSAAAVKRLAQRGGMGITASGVFEVVKLRLRSGDRRPHVVSSDLFALSTTSGTYYGAERPEDIGLSDRQWGALTTATAVPAQGAFNVKAVFDVPPGVLAHRVSLHIGPFGYHDGPPAQVLAIPRGAGCCAGAVRSQSSLASLVSSPVLGLVAPAD